MILKKVRQLPAPSEQDASSRLWSMRPSAVISGSVISGICTCASASDHADLGVEQPIGVSIAPIESSVELMMPWRPRMTIHAKVRTTTLVSSGSSTMRMISVCAARPDTVIEPRDREAEHQAQGGHFRAEQRGSSRARRG